MLDILCKADNSHEMLSFIFCRQCIFISECGLLQVLLALSRLNNISTKIIYIYLEQQQDTNDRDITDQYFKVPLYYKHEKRERKYLLIPEHAATKL